MIEDSMKSKKELITGHSNNRPVNSWIPKISLRRRLLFLVVIIWIIPVLLICLFMALYYRNNIIEKTTILMEEYLKNFTYYSAQRIDEAIDISKETSYEKVIEKAWRRYTAEDMTKADLYRQITGNLKSRFYNDNRFVMSVFYLSEEPDRIYYTSRKDSSYIDIFKEDVEAIAHNITKEETSDAHVKVINGRIYIIRNLYTLTNYTKFGTLVLELNTDKLIDGFSLNKDYELGFFINDTSSMIVYSEDLYNREKSGIIEMLYKEYCTEVDRASSKYNDKPYTGLIYQHKYNDYHYGGILVSNDDVIFSELNDLYVVMFFIMSILIPVFIYMIYFIAHHLSKPMGRMIEATKTMEQGNLGKQIEGDPMPNQEFDLLMVSFNQMSKEISDLFKFAYNEQIARKDAKIMALQSQINPHFLNNTLEMMNWQARMAGDITVSKMIEALGTLLNSSMDRSNKKLIDLSEELRCVDAYLYIVSMRFGKRLKIEKEIDQELLQIQVPQLILQPLIENAVVHGVEVVKNGTIQIRIYKEEDNVILQITNTGKDMTKEDIEKVRSLLNSDSMDSKDKNHNSLGIKNVNERIKLIYGVKYGLTIEPLGDGVTGSTITIPNKKKQIWQENANNIKMN